MHSIARLGRLLHAVTAKSKNYLSAAAIGYDYVDDDDDTDEVVVFVIVVVAVPVSDKANSDKRDPRRLRPG